MCRAGPRRKIPARAGTTPRRVFVTSMSKEDPRAGGDDGGMIAAYLGIEGRSPRGRGRPRPRSAPSRRRWKIPARAGTTDRGELHRPIPAEDPRAGGDDISLKLDHSGYRGRSPCGRGRLDSTRAALGRCRKIPARAGTTPTERPRGPDSREDPRAGGDDCYFRNAAARSCGRSPHGRGRRFRWFWGFWGCRKIPARAGTTGALTETGNQVEEDPRAGGDDDR